MEQRKSLETKMHAIPNNTMIDAEECLETKERKKKTTFYLDDGNEDHLMFE